MKSTIVYNNQTTADQVKDTLALLTKLTDELSTPTQTPVSYDDAITILQELAGTHFATDLGIAATTAANILIEAKHTVNTLTPRKVVADWIIVHGHRTNLAELARIFNVNSHTLRNRYKSGWPIEAALVAPPDGTWKYHNVMTVQKNPTVIPFVKSTLDRHFDTI